VRLDVRPAELIDGGIVIFTKDGNSRSDLPSPQNGWNTVIYKRDDARASDLEVLEAPGPANDWGQLILRNGDRRLSIIVLDWRSAK
jgi:hypothetical protein